MNSWRFTKIGIKTRQIAQSNIVASTSHWLGFDFAAIQSNNFVWRLISNNFPDWIWTLHINATVHCCTKRGVVEFDQYNQCTHTHARHVHIQRKVSSSKERRRKMKLADANIEVIECSSPPLNIMPSFFVLMLNFFFPDFNIYLFSLLYFFSHSNLFISLSNSVHILRLIWPNRIWWWFFVVVAVCAMRTYASLNKSPNQKKSKH